MKLKYVNSSPSTRSSVCTKVYHSKTMSDQRFKCYTKVYHSRTISDRRFECYTKDKRALIVAQRTCDNEVLDYVST